MCQCKILVVFASVSYEGSGESAHVRILARAFDARIHKIWMDVDEGQIKGSCAYAISAKLPEVGSHAMNAVN